jgi:hypothetical protein
MIDDLMIDFDNKNKKINNVYKLELKNENFNILEEKDISYLRNKY